MRNTFYFSVILLLINTPVFAQVDSITYERVPDWSCSTLFESSLMSNYELDDTRNPFYLEADFSGDGLIDIAFFIKNKINKKTGVLIVNRGKNLAFVLGAGKDNVGIGTDLFWCNRWFVYRDKFIYNFDDKKKRFMISNPGLEIVKSDQTSVVVYWDKKRYKTYIKNI